jgi:hypothetical protein
MSYINLPACFTQFTSCWWQALLGLAFQLPYDLAKFFVYNKNFCLQLLVDQCELRSFVITVKEIEI